MRMQERDITPEDYETLMHLHEADNKPQTLTAKELDRFPVLTVVSKKTIIIAGDDCMHKPAEQETVVSPINGDDEKSSGCPPNVVHVLLDSLPSALSCLEPHPAHPTQHPAALADEGDGKCHGHCGGSSSGTEKEEGGDLETGGEGGEEKQTGESHGDQQQHRGGGASGGQQVAEGMQCMVCMENLVAGEKARGLPCKHVFHKACIDTWLTESSISCPLRDWEASTTLVGTPLAGKQACL